MEKNLAERAILIDSSALIHRAYHAYPPSLTGKDGEPTNAVYGFTKTLLEIIEKFKPKYMVCLFDSGKKTFRHKEYPLYKANRKEVDPELKEQFPRAMEVVEAMNIPLFVMEGYEADDLIGTMAHKNLPKDLEKIIVTGDGDIMQLVEDQDNVSVYMAGSAFSQSKLFRSADVEDKYGLRPEQVIDNKGLLGDASDNIPGVKGVGKKGAMELLKKFDHLDAIYESLDRDDPIWEEQPYKRMKKKLIDGKDMAYKSQMLATIVTDLELDFDLRQAEVADYNREKVKTLFMELQFRSLMGKLPKSNGDKSSLDTAETGSSAANQMDLFGVPNVGDPQNSNNSKNSKAFENSNYVVIQTEKDALEKIEKVQKSKILAFDTETDGLDSLNANVLGLGIGLRDGKAFYLTKEILGSKRVATELGKLFSGLKDRLYIAHNLKFDLHMLSNYFRDHGLDVDLSSTDKCFDTMLAAYLLNGGQGSIGLKNLAFNILGMEMDTLEGLLGDEGKKGIDATKLDEIVLGRYCCADCDATFQLYDIFQKDLEKDPAIKKLFFEIEVPIIGVLLSMEREGVFLDVTELQNLQKVAEKQVSDLQKSIYDSAGVEFNILSPKQVGEVLFDKLHLHEDAGVMISKTKSGNYSTDERMLRNFPAEYKIVHEVLEYRELSKLISTYLVGLGDQIDKKTGKVHTSYNQTIASTGRLSSINPNLQNIPIASELGSQIRKGFYPGKDRKFLAFDYAQQELRLLAHLSGEDKLIQAFKDDLDIHSLTASQILDVPIDQVTKGQRRTGKTVNFGVVYGISGFGLSDRLKIPRKEADEFIRRFFETYPRVKDYFDTIKTDARTTGEIRTLMGRKRDASGLMSKNYQVRAATEREIINYPLQGGAADIMKKAMVEVFRDMKSGTFKGIDLKLHLQVHDELIFSIPTSMGAKEMSDLAKQIQDAMSKIVKLKVPVEVDAEVGVNWYVLKSV